MPTVLTSRLDPKTPKLSSEPPGRAVGLMRMVSFRCAVLTGQIPCIQIAALVTGRCRLRVRDCAPDRAERVR